MTSSTWRYARATQAEIAIPFVRLVAATFLVLAAAGVATIWLDSRQAWILHEIPRTAGYYLRHDLVTGEAKTSLAQQLGTVLQWRAFDTVGRVRQLSDAATTVDLLSWPLIARTGGVHPSLTPVSLLVALLSPLLLFHGFRYLDLDLIWAAVWVAVFLTSVAFLSTIVPYYWPAKRLAVLSLCLALYLAARFAAQRESWIFIGLISILFISQFTDEQAVIIYPMIALMLARKLLTGPRWQLAAFLSVPLAVLAMVTWLLPAVYLAVDPTHAWDMIHDAKRQHLLAYLSDTTFWNAVFVHHVAALLTILGVYRQTLPIYILTFTCFLLAATLLPALAIRHSRTRERAEQYVGFSASLGGAALYVTLVDWYPFPGGPSYMGMWTYYYHSLFGVLAIIWLALTWDMLLKLIPGRRLQVVLSGTGLVLAACVVVTSLIGFSRINVVTQAISWLPYSEPIIIDEVQQTHRTGSSAVPLQPASDAVTREAESALEAIYGANWPETPYGGALRSMRGQSLVAPDDGLRLRELFFPE